ncbi:unnamed protein product [Alternaria alternata]
MSSAFGPIAEAHQDKFDLGIWHALFNWANLTVAVQNQWGGPDSSDVEVVLLQVLEDEFGVRVEDETEVAVAREIMTIRKEIGEGNTATSAKGKEVSTGSVNVKETNQEGEWDSVDEESDEDDDVEMGEAPALVPAKPKPEPEVDDEGFTKVVGKKKR